MPNVKIYVANELKAQMDAADDTNWSALAQRAFSHELRSQEWRRQLIEESNMESVVVRLRESRDRAVDAETDRGFDAGAQWAKVSAEYTSLKRAAEFECGQNYVNDIAEVFVGFLVDENVMGAALDFWTDIDEQFRYRGPSGAFVMGFQAGAASVWEKVADEL